MQLQQPLFRGRSLVSAVTRGDDRSTRGSEGSGRLKTDVGIGAGDNDDPAREILGADRIDLAFRRTG